MNRRTLESLLLRAIKHHHVTSVQTIGNSTSRITQQAQAELLAAYLDTHLPTGKRCTCGKEIRGHRVKYCSDRCQAKLSVKKLTK